MKNNLIYLTASALAIVSLAAHAEDLTSSPPPKWTGSAAAGLTLTRGNSDTVLATLSFAADRKWAPNELSVGTDGAYGKSKINGVNNTTAESLHGFIQYNRLITEHWYGYGRVDALHDAVADIKYRVMLSPGAGYYFIKNTNTDLSLEAGPGYIFERLDDKDKNYATLRVGEKLHQALSDRARLWQTVEWLPQVDNFNNYIINFEIGLEADLSSSKKLTLRTYLDDIYNNVPAPGRQKSDAKLVAAIAYKF